MGTKKTGGRHIVTIPEATIKHRLPGRLRLCIPARKGDLSYFKTVETRLREVSAWKKINSSPLTGSLVIEDDTLDMDAVSDAAESNALFSVQVSAIAHKPFAKRIVDSISGFNHWIKSLSDGSLDLPGILFLILIVFGLWELARGNLRRPPWYTALWYAFGLFSKTLLDEFNHDNA
jgi:hypothetical protein